MSRRDDNDRPLHEKVIARLSALACHVLRHTKLLDMGDRENSLIRVVPPIRAFQTPKK
jgi:hypothetical protein